MRVFTCCGALLRRQVTPLGADLPGWRATAGLVEDPFHPPGRLQRWPRRPGGFKRHTIVPTKTGAVLRPGVFGHRQQVAARRREGGLHGIGQGAPVQAHEKHFGDIVGQQ